MRRWVASRRDFIRLAIVMGGLTPAIIVVGIVLSQNDAPNWATYIAVAVFTSIAVLRVMVPDVALPASASWRRVSEDARSGEQSD